LSDRDNAYTIVRTLRQEVVMDRHSAYSGNHGIFTRPQISKRTYMSSYTRPIDLVGYRRILVICSVGH
jgi:hypothetical protein